MFLPRVMWVPKGQGRPQVSSNSSQSRFSERQVEGVKDSQKGSSKELEDYTKNHNVPDVKLVRKKTMSDKFKLKSLPLDDPVKADVPTVPNYSREDVVNGTTVEAVRKKARMTKFKLKPLPLAEPFCEKADVPSGPDYNAEGNGVSGTSDIPPNVEGPSLNIVPHTYTCEVGQSRCKDVNTPHHAVNEEKDPLNEQNVCHPAIPRNFIVVINKPYIDVIPKAQQSPLRTPHLVKTRHQYMKKPMHYTPMRRGRHLANPWRKLHGQHKIVQSKRCTLSARFAKLKSKDTPKEQTIANDSPEKTAASSNLAPPVHEWLSNFFGTCKSYGSGHGHNIGGTAVDNGSFVKLRSMLRALQTGNVNQWKTGDVGNLDTVDSDVKDLHVENSSSEEPHGDYGGTTDDDDSFAKLQSMLRALQTGNVDQPKDDDGGNLEKEDGDVKDIHGENGSSEEYDEDVFEEKLEMQEEDMGTSCTESLQMDTPGNSEAKVRGVELKSKDTPKEQTIANNSPGKMPASSYLVPPVHEWLSSFFGTSYSYGNGHGNNTGETTNDDDSFVKLWSMQRALQTGNVHQLNAGDEDDVKDLHVENSSSEEKHGDNGETADDDGSFVKLRSMLRALQTGDVHQLKAGDGENLDEDDVGVKDLHVENSSSEEYDDEYDDDVFEQLKMEEEDMDTSCTEESLQVDNTEADVSVELNAVKKPPKNIREDIYTSWDAGVKHTESNNNNYKVGSAGGGSSPVVESWLQATYKGGKNVKLSEEEIPTGCEEDVELIDWKHLLCLLCRRKFNCKGELLRHQQFSNLHESNLQLKRRTLEEELKVLEMELEPSSSSSIFPYA
ncbi:RBM10 [Branchiostoma lanceolatum]|uniref:RBM10 protein n=1 Tax=Branchiostoma lanceolatum TaxID=7740 RepID=A0A8K0EHV6_BRALA|nr:RBM10 [Branchiostoma lanceolatum]